MNLFDLLASVFPPYKIPIQCICYDLNICSDVREQARGFLMLMNYRECIKDESYDYTGTTLE